jgi:uncharacterized protein YjbI with pentapeptide repeats
MLQGLHNGLPFVCLLPCPILSCLQRKAHCAVLRITGIIYFDKQLPFTAMARPYFEDEVFDQSRVTQQPLQPGEYEGCRFEGCSLAGIDLSDFVFTDCDFVQCNLGNTILSNTTLNDVRFKDCKLTGLDFEVCNKFLFSMSFKQCNLSWSSFTNRTMKNTLFNNCQMVQVDFSGANLGGSQFVDCDLQDASFNQANLEKCDFSKAFHYNIDPSANNIHKAKFTWPEIMGLLRKYDIDVS